MYKVHQLFLKRCCFHPNFIWYLRLRLIWIYFIGFFIRASRKTEADIFIKYNEFPLPSLNPFELFPLLQYITQVKITILSIFSFLWLQRIIYIPFRKCSKNNHHKAKNVIIEQKDWSKPNRSFMKEEGSLTEVLWKKLDWVSKLSTLKKLSTWESCNVDKVIDQSCMKLLYRFRWEGKW